ncbi:MAG: hypothetical protein V2A69_14335 [Pseudomonadota bacterium]
MVEVLPNSRIKIRFNVQKNNHRMKKILVSSCIILVFTILPRCEVCAMNANPNRLIELAEKEFGTLTKAETILFSMVAMSRPIDFSAGNIGDRNVIESSKWGEDRVIKASRIAWLCRDGEAASLVGQQGIAITGARIVERVYLFSLKIPFPIILDYCSIPEDIYLRHAEMQDIGITHSHTGSIVADAVKMTGSLILRNCMIQGNIHLINAAIKGNLDLKGSHLINKNKQTMTADHLTVGGSILLNDGFKSAGTIELNGANIGGDLQCANSHFLGAESLAALLAQFVKINGNVIMNKNFRAEEMVDFRGAIIKGRIECMGGHLKKNKTDFAFCADAAKIDGGIIFDQAVVIGGLRLHEAKIDIMLQCEGAKLINEKGQSLFLQGAEIGGSLFLRDVESRGEVNLAMARVDGNFECDRSQFINQGAKSISAEGIRVNGSIFLRDGFQSTGEISLMNSFIGQDLICSRGHFSTEDKDKHALLIEQSEIRGKASFMSAKIRGKVGFARAKIANHLKWIDLVSPELTTLDLRYAKIGAIWDDERSWPSQNNLWLKGLVFDEFDSRTLKDIDVKARIKWIRLQPSDRFYPQSYEQLALVYIKEGREEDAKQVLIEKNKDASFISQMSFFEKLWHRFLGCTIGYGYRPFCALRWMFAIIVLGWICFGLGNYHELMTPSKTDTYISPSTIKEKIIISPNYPKFSYWIYSIDAFFPVINLNMKNHWLPNAKKGDKYFRYFTSGELLRVYLIIHTFAGWILTTIFLVGLTGLIKK